MIRYYKNGFVPDIYEGDENVRYVLGKRGTQMLFYVGINPNIANDSYSDPTMNVFINVMSKWEYDGCIMINPAPYRSAQPKDIPYECDNNVKLNLNIIERLFTEYKGSDILCGWGDYIIGAPEWYKESLRKIVELANQNNIRFLCIKKNRSGQPTSLSYLLRDKGFDRGKGEYKLQGYDVIIP